MLPLPVTGVKSRLLGNPLFKKPCQNKSHCLVTATAVVFRRGKSMLPYLEMADIWKVCLPLKCSKNQTRKNERSEPAR